MKQQKKPKSHKARQSGHNASTGKYKNQWARTLKNKLRRIRKNAVSKSVRSREEAKLHLSQEARRN